MSLQPGLASCQFGQVLQKNGLIMDGVQQDVKKRLRSGDEAPGARLAALQRRWQAGALGCGTVLMGGVAPGVSVPPRDAGTLDSP